MPRTLSHRLLYRQFGHRYKFWGMVSLGSVVAAVGVVIVIDIFIIIVNIQLDGPDPDRVSHCACKAGLPSAQKNTDSMPLRRCHTLPKGS